MIVQGIFASRMLRRNFPVKVPALPQSENAGISLKIPIYTTKHNITFVPILRESNVALECVPVMSKKIRM